MMFILLNKLGKLGMVACDFGSIPENPWKNFGTKNNINSSDKGWNVLVSIAQDWYTLCLTIGTVGLLITLIILGAKLFITRNSRNRAEVKDAITSKIIVAIVFFSITLIIGLTVTIAESLV